MAETPLIPVPALERVARVEVKLDPPRSLGAGPWGERRLVPIVGGTFEGPRLRIGQPAAADHERADRTRMCRLVHGT